MVCWRSCNAFRGWIVCWDEKRIVCVAFWKVRWRFVSWDGSVFVLVMVISKERLQVVMVDVGKCVLKK